MESPQLTGLPGLSFLPCRASQRPGETGPRVPSGLQALGTRCSPSGRRGVSAPVMAAEMAIVRGVCTEAPSVGAEPSVREASVPGSTGGGGERPHEASPQALLLSARCPRVGGVFREEHVSPCSVPPVNVWILKRSL